MLFPPKPQSFLSQKLAATRYNDYNVKRVKHQRYRVICLLVSLKICNISSNIFWTLNCTSINLSCIVQVITEPFYFYFYHFHLSERSLCRGFWQCQHNVDQRPFQKFHHKHQICPALWYIYYRFTLTISISKLHKKQFQKNYILYVWNTDNYEHPHACCS